MGALFHWALDWISENHASALESIGSVWVAIAVFAPTSAAMATLAAFMVRRIAPEAAGSGIQEVDAVVEGDHEFRWFRTLWVKFVGGLLALGSGMVLGREGPTVQMGAAVGKGVSEGMKLPDREQRGLVAAGAAAGLAAAFNAPLAAILFVTEEMRQHFPFKRHTYIGLIIAAIFGAIVSEGLSGTRFQLRTTIPGMPLTFLPFVVLGGIVVGVVGVMFNRSLLKGLDIVDNFPDSVWWVPAFIVGGASGVLLVTFPYAVGGGEELVRELSTTGLSAVALLAVCVLRISGAIVSYATRVPGGIFAPMLAIAASLGLAMGTIFEGVGSIEHIDHTFAIIAMAALFAACVQAPVVATVLVLELTGAYELLLPMLLACATALVTAQCLNGRPIYAMLLERSRRLAANKPEVPLP